MSFFSSIGKAWQVGNEARLAVGAAQDSLARGESPFKAWRVFAAHTHGKFDDEALESVLEGTKRIIQGLDACVQALAWVAEHEAQVKDGLAKSITFVTLAVGLIVEVGYQAGRVRWKLNSWLEDA